MKKLLTQSFKDLGNLFFPKLCLACGEIPIRDDEITCTKCSYELPIQTNYQDQDNELSQLFDGRVELEMVTAMFKMTKEGRIQHLVHQLKYKNARAVGVFLGEHFGKKLSEVAHFRDISAIVPVPLHPKKQRQRGYNQSEAFSEGLARSMQKRHLPNALKRVIHADSLTRKNRQERFQTIENAYIVRQSKLLTAKHILLVDDVLTTGATIEICAQQLLSLPNTRVSVAVIARATSM